MTRRGTPTARQRTRSTCQTSSPSTGTSTPAARLKKRPNVAGDDSKGDVLVGVPLDLAGRADPDGVGVQKQRHHHLRMVWRISPQLALVVVVDGPKVELGDQVEDEVGEV